MSALSVKQREAVKDPVSNFADPQNRLLPIYDQADIEAAAKLYGKTKNPEAAKFNIIKIAKAKGLKLPDAWQDSQANFKDEPMSQKADKDVAVFSAKPFALDESAKVSPDGEFVRRKAPIIFRAGDYPDKKFSMTPEELQGAVESFSPVEIGLEHIPTVLNGKLGKLVTVGLSENWQEASGEALIPRWLDDLLTKDDRRLSVAFDRNTKQLIGCDLVRNPRVNDACLLAAFSKKHTPAPGKTKSDESAETEDDDKVLFDESDTPEFSKEAAVADEPDADEAESGEYADSRNDEGINDEEKPAKKKNKPAKSMTEYDTEEETGSTPSTADFSEEINQLKAQLAEERKHRVQAEAVAFANGEIQAERSLPAERDALLFAFTQAAHDDAATGSKVTFSGKSMTRVEALKAQHAARQPHVLQKEFVRGEAGKQSRVLFNGNEHPESMTDERRSRLMGATPLGRTIVNGNGHAK